MFANGETILMANIYSDYTKMRGKNQILSYVGSLNGELIASLLQIADSKLTEHKIAKKPKKNIINILIECLQNIFYHTDNPKISFEESRNCIFNMSYDTEQYVLQAGNFMPTEKVKGLKARLDNIKPMTAKELHLHYLEVLDKGEMSSKGGAGLGMIRMFRESNQQVDYTFKKISEEVSFYSVEIRITVNS